MQHDTASKGEIKGDTGKYLETNQKRVLCGSKREIYLVIVHMVDAEHFQHVSMSTWSSAKDHTAQGLCIITNQRYHNAINIQTLDDCQRAPTFWCT